MKFTRFQPLGCAAVLPWPPLASSTVTFQRRPAMLTG